MGKRLERTVSILYTNWRGETGWRWVQPKEIVFLPEGNEWHPHPGYYLQAYDLDKQEDRTFRMADIKEWEEEIPR